MWLIIGYGNSLCADDGFGIAVAEQLRSLVTENMNVTIVACQQLLPELVEQIRIADEVIFIDASTSFPTNTLTLSKLCDLDPSISHAHRSLFSHHCSASELIGAASVLYGVSPEAWLCTVGGQTFTLGTAMSDSVLNMVPKAVEAIRGKLEANA